MRFGETVGGTLVLLRFTEALHFGNGLIKFFVDLAGLGDADAEEIVTVSTSVSALSTSSAVSTFAPFRYCRKIPAGATVSAADGHAVDGGVIDGRDGCAGPVDGRDRGAGCAGRTGCAGRVDGPFGCAGCFGCAGRAGRAL